MDRIARRSRLNLQLASNLVSLARFSCVSIDERGRQPSVYVSLHLIIVLWVKYRYTVHGLNAFCKLLSIKFSRYGISISSWWKISNNLGFVKYWGMDVTLSRLINHTRHRYTRVYRTITIRESTISVNCTYINPIIRISEYRTDSLPI